MDVYLDGEKVGSTPLWLRKVESGLYALRIERADDADIEIRKGKIARIGLFKGSLVRFSDVDMKASPPELSKEAKTPPPPRAPQPEEHEHERERDISSETSKGQVTIPKAIRDFLKVEKYDKIVFIPLEDGKVMITTKKAPASAVFGMLKHRKPKKPVSVEDMESEIHKRRSERVKK